jgi:hypothetical protein
MAGKLCELGNDGRPPANQDFFPGGLRAWPVSPCDFLYSETELFGLSDFGFLASLLLLI